MTTAEALRLLAIIEEAHRRRPSQALVAEALLIEKEVSRRSME